MLDQRIICHMIQRNVSAIVLLLFASFMVAQTAQRPVQTAQFPQIRIDFGEGVSLEDVWLEYSLSGPDAQHRDIGLSGPSRDFGHIPSGAPFYEIEASVDGYAVDRFKALVWAPGCKMQQFDIALGTSSVELPFACDKLESVTLVGRVRQVSWSVHSRVFVDYVGALGTFFAGPLKGSVQRIGGGIFVSIPEIATAEVGADGTFRIALPGFGAGPVASRVNNDAEFGFVLRETVLAPGHANYRQTNLEPALKDDLHGPMMGLRIATSYPSDVIFVPRKPN